jgi:hypothetical protein
MSSDATLDRDERTVTVRVPLKIRRHGGLSTANGVRPFRKLGGG